MLIHAKTLANFTMRATDGELGMLDDFYVDSHTLQLRYFVGDTRTWFFGGKVLLSPQAFTEVDMEERSIAVKATKQQIKDSPKPDDHAPINRYYEQELNDHYGWPSYWSVPSVPVASSYGTNTAAGAPLIPPVSVPRGKQNPEDTVENIRTGADEHKMEERYQEQVHLFSLDELKGYRVHAKGGEVGKVLDFVIQKETDWHVRYMVVDTGGFMKREPVLVSMDGINEVTWFDKSIVINVDKEKVESAPVHRTDTPLTREYEQNVYNHYEQPPYWAK